MNSKFIIIFILQLLFIGNTVLAETVNQNLWTTGKIYVVLGVLITIFTGIIIFLILLERKISSLEKRIK